MGNMVDSADKAANEISHRGAMDRLAGKRSADNPWPPGCEEHDLWLGGWKSVDVHEPEPDPLEDIPATMALHLKDGALIVTADGKPIATQDLHVQPQPQGHYVVTAIFEVDGIKTD